MTAHTLRIGLSQKAVAFVATATLLVVVSTTALNVFADRVTHERDLLTRAEALGETTVVLAADATAVHNTIYLERLMIEAAAQPDITYAAIHHPDGYALADADPETMLAKARVDDPLISRALATGFICEVLGRQAHLAVPIVREGRSVGVLRLGVDLSSTNQRSLDIITRNLWFALVALGLVAPLALAGIRHVVHPIQQLTTASTRVAARDFDVKIDVHSGDELETLATSFNAMVTELRDSLNRIRWLAFMDDLTKLPNKTVFVEKAHRRLHDAKTPGAILLINLDRFKRLNDTFGESAGDQILVAASERLRSIADDLHKRFQHTDAQPPLLARMSGDEFALLICGPAPTGAAKHCAEAIVRELREPLTISNQQVSLTASVGIARFPLDASDADHLMRHANLALDAAKADGGSVYQFFEPEMTRRAVERVTLENELRRAVKNREFEVHYQPKIDARSGAIVGCESLVRWRREGRIVGPNHFIEAAEESGLIVDIGNFVLEEACQAAAAWTAEGLRAHVAINVSAVQFDRDDFTRTVMRAIRQAGVEPELIELELTESVAMNAPERVIAQIEPLRAKGVRFAIDDFGTGYSSLSSLTRLPFDVFKIDQSFVRGMDQDQNARVVIETILAMARALGYDTVAEGVETEAHFAFLRLNGCTHAQGWLFGKPVPLDEFMALLRNDAQPAQATAPTLARGAEAR